MDNSIGAILRNAREKKGLSQHEMALKMGYSKGQYVSNWERGVCGIPANQEIAFCRITGMKPSEMEEILIRDAISKIKSRMAAAKNHPTSPAKKNKKAQKSEAEQEA